MKSQMEATIHMRNYFNEEGVRSRLELHRTSYMDFDLLEVVVDGDRILGLFIDKGDFPNFPTYDSQNDSKGDTSE